MNRIAANRTIAFPSPKRPMGAFFHWESLGEPIAVYFHLNTIEILEQAAIRGGEKGTAGVLLGRIENGPRPILIVEDFEPIPSLAKPNDNASAVADGSEWESTLARWSKESEKRLSVLGFYRSCTGTPVAAADRDLRVLTKDTRDTDRLLLLVEPRIDGPSSGFLSMVRNGEEVWRWDGICFNRHELAHGGAYKSTGAQLAPRTSRTEDVEIVESPNTLAAPPEKKLKGLSTTHWLIGSAIGVIVVLIATIAWRGNEFFHSGSSGSDSASASSLGLKTQRTGSDLQVSWDKNAAVLGNATGGHLSIADGIIHKTVELDGDELKSGSITYTPVTDNIALHLDVMNGQSTVLASESVRSVSGLLPPIAGIAPNLPSSASSRPHSGSSATVSQTSKSGSGNAAGKNGIAARSAADAQPKPRVPTRQAVSDEALAANLPNLAVAAHEPTASPALTLPEVASPNSAIPEPASAAPGTRAVSGPDGRIDQVSSPQLISSSSPVYSQKAREQEIAGTVTVYFRIGSDGQVATIHGVTGPAPLKQAVVDAVKTRRYIPAKLNGKAVESEESLVYVFKLH